MVMVFFHAGHAIYTHYLWSMEIFIIRLVYYAGRVGRVSMFGLRCCRRGWGMGLDHGLEGWCGVSPDAL